MFDADLKKRWICISQFKVKKEVRGDERASPYHSKTKHDGWGLSALDEKTVLSVLQLALIDGGERSV